MTWNMWRRIPKSGGLFCAAMALAFSATYPAAGAQLPQNWCDTHPGRCVNNHPNYNTGNNNGQTCITRETFDVNGNYVKTTICR
ncbi:hypothetical protein [Streptomyces sp. NPDC020298]|uniref:hypothetical protein n=1 Tax=unclassified Streptomyces TaxID=2593676 RepID=UPI0033FDBB5D